MAKKDLSTLNNPAANKLTNSPVFALDDTQPVTDPAGRGRPRKEEIIREKGAQQGLTADYTRTTFILNVHLLEKLKDYAYTKRITLKDALEEILTGYFTEYENNPENETLLKHGKR